MSKLKYFKLGSKASAFFCPKCQLKVVNGVPGKVLFASLKTSGKAKVAKNNGHIVEIDEAEYKKMMSAEKAAIKEDDGSTKVAVEESSEVTPADIKKMTKDQLYTYYKDNYEVEEDDLAEFKTKTAAEAKAFLIELESEEE